MSMFTLLGEGYIQTNDMGYHKKILLLLVITITSYVILNYNKFSHT